MLFDAVHFGGGFAQFGIVGIRGDRVAEQQERLGGLVSIVRGGKQVERTGVCDPVVWSWIGDEERLEIQCVQRAVRDDKELGIIRQRRLRWLDEHAVERESLSVASL